jgi:hypothetical protein
LLTSFFFALIKNGNKNTTYLCIHEPIFKYFAGVRIKTNTALYIWGSGAKLFLVKEGVSCGKTYEC